MPGITKFRRIQTTDDEINLLQSNLSDTLGGLTSNPLLSGKLIAGVPLGVGPNQIAHGLGRNYVSCLAGIPSAPAALSYGATQDRTKYVTVISSAPCVVDIYIY